MVSVVIGTSSFFARACLLMSFIERQLTLQNALFRARRPDRLDPLDSLSERELSRQHPIFQTKCAYFFRFADTRSADPCQVRHLLDRPRGVPKPHAERGVSRSSGASPFTGYYRDYRPDPRVELGSMHDVKAEPHGGIATSERNGPDCQAQLQCNLVPLVIPQYLVAQRQHFDVAITFLACVFE